MAYIASKVMWWKSVPDMDYYKIRVAPKDEIDLVAQNDTLTEDQYENMAHVLVAHHENKLEHEYDLSSTDLTRNLEGEYDFFITAVDKGGNESDPLDFQDKYVDLKAPEKPENGGFRGGV